MKKVSLILVVLFFSNIVFGQIGLQSENSFSEAKPLTKIFKQSDNNFFSMEKKQDALPVDLKNYFLSDKQLHISSNSNIFQKNKNTETAFFCRIESQIEKSSKLPVRFRLGEVQAVDKKEGKWQQFNQ